MEKNLRSLNGLPVILSGKRIGRVAQAAVSDDLKHMEGIWVDAGLSGARFIGAEAIQVLGKVSVTVDSPGKRQKMHQRPLFRRVVTTSGTRLGAVVGASVDEVSFQIASLQITTGFFDDLFSGRLDIRHFTANPDTGEVIADTSIREGDCDEGRNGQGIGYRRASRRRGGNGFRYHELADGAPLVSADEQDGQPHG